jgi:hypothetical protein
MYPRLSQLACSLLQNMLMSQEPYADLAGFIDTYLFSSGNLAKCEIEKQREMLLRDEA